MSQPRRRSSGSQRSGKSGPPNRGSEKRSSGGRSSEKRSSGGRGSESRSSDERSSESRGPRRNSGRPKRTKAQIRGLGGDQVEGRQAVRELLLAGTRRVNEVVMIDDLSPADILDDITELAHEMKVTFRAVTRRRFSSEALTDSHQGVIARARPLNERTLESLAEVPEAFLIVLDGITDPGNLGAILRTAECAGVTGIVLGRHRAVHISPTVTKTAAGAIEHLSMAVVGGIPTAIGKLNDMGVHTIGLDAAGDVTVFDLPLTDRRPVALVLGAEGKGLSRLVRQRVKTVAAIPLSGQLNSLNVATAGAVACFEVVRCREGQTHN